MFRLEVVAGIGQEGRGKEPKGGAVARRRRGDGISLKNPAAFTVAAIVFWSKLHLNRSS